MDINSVNMAVRTVLRKFKDPTSDVNGALGAAYAGVSGKKKGGNVLKPVRMPTLHIEREWPNADSDHKIVWAQGNTAYAMGTDNSLRKSLDGGRTWTVRTFNYSLSNYRGMFLKLASGAIVQVRNNSPLQFYRSADDGATWVAGTQCRTNGLFLTAQSWAQDAVTGYIYAVEYHTSDGTFADVRVYRSTDDGVTFSVWYTFPGPTTSDPNKVRHGHSVQYDSVSQRIYVQMGDADNAAGIYRVTADGSTLEPIVTRAMLAAGGLVTTPNMARAIGIMWFPDYIAWGVDEPDGEIVRMARSEIGKSAPVIERIYGITSGGWGSTKASADGSVWLTFGSAEQDGGIALDRNLHVYAVSDNGATVWEVGSIPAAGQAFAAPAAVGQAELHSDVLWFGTRGMDVGVVDRYYKAQLGVGLQQIGSTHSARPLYYGAAESASDHATLAAAGQWVIGYTKAPLVAHRLFILGMGCKGLSGTGSLRIRAYRKDTNVMLFESSSPNVKGGIVKQEAVEYAYSIDLPADTEVEFRLQETGGTATVEGVGHVTFAWGI